MWKSCFFSNFSGRYSDFEGINVGKNQFFFLLSFWVIFRGQSFFLCEGGSGGCTTARAAAQGGGQRPWANGVPSLYLQNRLLKKEQKFWLNLGMKSLIFEKMHFFGLLPTIPFSCFFCMLLEYKIFKNSPVKDNHHIKFPSIPKFFLGINLNSVTLLFFQVALQPQQQ